MATSQRDVRNRIGAVKNIQKITRAMEMVAAARLRRAEQRIEALRPYADAIRRMTRQAAEAAGAVPRLPILSEHENVRSVGLLLVAGDRGLACHPPDRARVRPQRLDPLLGSAQTRGGDHLHRARDLLDVLDGRNPLSDVSLGNGHGWLSGRLAA